MSNTVKRILADALWKAVKKRAALEVPTVIGITGAIGKTTTKEVLAAILETTRKPVRKSFGNLNTDIGVPLSILGFKSAPKGLLGKARILSALIWNRTPIYQNPFFVLEYSADHPGDISYLAAQLPLSVALITRIVPAHMQAYTDFSQLVKEKMSILAGLQVGGVAVLNADDPVQREEATNQKSVLWYGIKTKLGKQPGVWAHSLVYTKKGWKCEITFSRPKGMDTISSSQPQTIAVQTSLLGRHQIYALVAAAAVAMQMGVSLQGIRRALQGFVVPPGRGRLIQGVKDIQIIDDTYNASPEAVKQGIDMVTELPIKERKVIILGNMNELGSSAEAAHKEIAEYAAKKADFIVFVGPYSAMMVKAVEAEGHKGHHILSFANPEQLIDKIDQVVKRGDLLYIKGSQNGVRLERVVKKVMAHPELAEELLVRQ